MDDVRCPFCQGRSLIKFGRSKDGRQKYKCLAADCGRSHTADSLHRVDEETKALVVRMLGQGIKPKTIKASLGDGVKISMRWIYKLKRKLNNGRRR